MSYFGCEFVKFFACLPNFKAKFILSLEVRQVELPIRRGGTQNLPLFAKNKFIL
jgi:hypothetical protein